MQEYAKDIYFFLSKYLAVSDWLQYQGKFSITNWCLLYLEDASNQYHRFDDWK